MPGSMPIRSARFVAIWSWLRLVTSIGTDQAPSLPRRSETVSGALPSGSSSERVCTGLATKPATALPASAPMNAMSNTPASTCVTATLPAPIAGSVASAAARSAALAPAPSVAVCVASSPSESVNSPPPVRVRRCTSEVVAPIATRFSDVCGGVTTLVTCPLITGSAMAAAVPPKVTCQRWVPPAAGSRTTAGSTPWAARVVPAALVAPSRASRTAAAVAPKAISAVV